MKKKLSKEEREMKDLLVKNGWAAKEAEDEAVRALQDAAEEDGMG